MAGQTALQSETARQIERPENKNELIVEAEKLFARMRELTQKIEKRAYEFFEERGYEIGHDAEDWFRAESEYVRKIPLELQEDDTTIVARAEMSDFDEKEIHVNIAPHQLFIAARMERSLEEEKDELSSREQNSKEVFYSLALPCEVEADKAKATFNDGMLEISIPKLIAPEAKTVKGKKE